MLTGLLKPTEGSAKMQPKGRPLDVAQDTDEWKTHLGYMSQKFSLYLDLTAEENLTFFGSIYGLPKDRLSGRIQELSERLRFTKVLPALTEGLSTGYRQRVALAAALLHEPSSCSWTSRRAASIRGDGDFSGISSTSSRRTRA